MFKNEISSSPLLNDQANSLMSNITGDRFMGDCSFVSTLRALLFNRVPKEENITLKISRSDHSSSHIASVNKRDLARDICRSNNMIGVTGGFALHYFSNTAPAANTESFKIIEENFEALYPEYKRLDKVTEFYRKAFPVVCFLNHEKKSVALFVEQMDYRRYHYLQCAILPMFPWYFSPQAGITELEMNLVKSLMENIPDPYRDCIRKIYDTFDFRSALIRQQLSGFELRYIKDALADSEGQYRNITNTIADFNRRLHDELVKLNDLNFRITGMRKKLEEGSEDSEIMDYFLANKNLTLKSSSGSQIEFVTRGRLEYFDPEMAERAVNNKNSILYSRGSRMNKADREILWKAIFLDETIKVNVCAAFTLSINGGVNARSHYSYGDDFEDCMPHPHIDEYGCMGDYVRIVNELMQRHDYLMALEQCIASTRSLNFADSTVLGYFVSTMVDGGSKSRCIELPNGSVVKPDEAVKWLKEQKGSV